MKAVNLIPADQRRSAAPSAGRSQGAAYAVLFLLAGLAVLTLLYGSARHQISSRRAQLASLAVQTQQAQNATARLAPYTQFIALHEQRVQAVSTLAESRFNWAHAFYEVGRVLPPGVSLNSLTGTIGQPATSTKTVVGQVNTQVTSSTPPGSLATFSLSGCATSQFDVALALDRLRLMDGVTEVTLQSSTKAAGSGGSGGCAAGDASFGVTVSFEPLPSSPASGASATGSSSTPASGASATGSGSSSASTGAGG